MSESFRRTRLFTLSLGPRAIACAVVCTLGACADEAETEDPCLIEAPGQDQNFASTLGEWEARCMAEPASSGRELSVAEGTCADGKRALMLSAGLGASFRYFDEDGSFIAGRSQSDGIDMQCLGMKFWPKRVSCEDGIITRMICGSGLTVGRPLE